ncbi:MAG TPA: DUF3341 domain-containing protein [Anaerolineaceae bacterium]|jgi:hypothetical protein
MENRRLYGLLAEFETPDDLLAAVRKARAEGYRRIDAYTPFPVEGLSEAMALPSSPIPWIMLAGAVAGLLIGYFMQVIATTQMLTLNIGGRPLNSWPAYIPIAFETMVLFGAFSGLFGLFFLDGLPQPYHPVFNVPEFVRATSDRFYLGIEGRDLKFDRISTRQFLQGLGSHQISEVGM